MSDQGTVPAKRLEEAARFTLDGGDTRIASNGSQLKVSGLVRVDPRDSSSGKSAQDLRAETLVPVLALTSLVVQSRGGSSLRPSTLLTLRIWDGPDVRAQLPAELSREASEGLRALSMLVQAHNALWPMSAARALAARRQISPGYLSGPELLGEQGAKEFLSPLGNLDVSWASAWRKGGMASLWPLAAFEVEVDGSPRLLGVLPDRLVVIDQTGSQVTDLDFSHCGEPAVVCRGDGAPFEIGLQMSTTAQRAAVSYFAAPADAARMSPGVNHRSVIWFRNAEAAGNVARYSLYRWANSQAVAADDPSVLLIDAESQMANGDLSPVGFAAIVDAAIVRSAGGQPSVDFPVRERAYLRPAPATQAPQRSTTPVAQQRQQQAEQPQRRPGVTARQVAVGAVGAGALLNLFGD